MSAAYHVGGHSGRGVFEVVDGKARCMAQTKTTEDAERVVAALLNQSVAVSQWPNHIDTYFVEGARAGEDPNIHADNIIALEQACPYSAGSIGRHWWTRGFSYTKRLLRAIEAERRSDIAPGLGASIPATTVAPPTTIDWKNPVSVDAAVLWSLTATPQKLRALTDSVRSLVEGRRVPDGLICYNLVGRSLTRLKRAGKAQLLRGTGGGWVRAR